jgi:hypothetical protein
MRTLLVFILGILLLACNESNKQTEKVVIDPNNTSEMALLMREMFTQLDSVKLKLELRHDLSNSQLNFALIHEQKATDESFRKEGLEGMSWAYSNAVYQFNDSPTLINYRTVINSCVSCHQSLCPGPLERIDNLIIR